MKPLPLNTVRDWLINEAGFLADFGLVLQGLCERLLQVGLPLARATSHIRVIHSERVGVTRLWRRGKGVEEQHFGFGQDVDDMYQRSPIKVVHDTAQRLELWPGQPGAQNYGILSDLHSAGITHYVIFPVFFTSGRVNALSFATDRPSGFTGAELNQVDSLLPAVSRVMELKGLQRSQGELLRIYVGELPAQRILEGQIRRGDVMGMEAAILLCDLRRSTELANDLSEADYIALLNRYFDCVVPAIKAAGGEVLKFIGDAVLAIFDLPKLEGDCAHCRGALAAAEAIQVALDKLNQTEARPLEVAIALHEGRVAFGNVGSVERQDFTVIGPDVNLAARLCALSSQVGEPLLLSERFASRIAGTSRKLGDYSLKGFATPQSVFVPKRH